MFCPVSVIVPVYNAGVYLASTVDALLRQSLPNIEILLMDDAATDGSAQYCQRLAEQYPDTVRHVSNAVNMGTGVTRNLGLGLARGKYIAFCDHDDLPMPHMLSDLYEAARARQAHMVIGAYTISRHTKETIVPIVPEDHMVFGTQATVLFPVWNKLFHAGFLREHGITFAQARTFEDAGFVCKVLAHKPRIATVEHVIYKHIPRESSASYSLRLRNETLTGLEDLATYLKAHGLYRKNKLHFLRAILRHAFYYPACLFFLDTLLYGKSRRANISYAPVYTWKALQYLLSTTCKS